MIFALVLREARSRIGKKRMGAAWLLLEPIFHLLILSVLYTYVRGRSLSGVEYPVFVFIGLAPFLLYRNIAIRLMDSPRENRSLFAYKQIKPLDAFMARAIVEASIAAIVYAIISFAFFWYGFDMSIVAPIQWMAVLLMGLLFAFGLGVVLSLITHVLPSAKLFIRMMFFPLYFISGIFIPPAYLPQSFMPVLIYNPFLHIVEALRVAVFPHYVPMSGLSIKYPLALTVVLLFVALGVYRIRRLHLVSSKNG